MIAIILAATAAVLVMLKGVAVLNAMSRHSHDGVRLAWLALTGGAAAIILSLAQPAAVPPTWAQLLFDWAVVGLVMCDRRSRIGGAA